MNVFLLMVTPGVSGRLLSFLPPWHEQSHLQNTHGIYENETGFLYLLHIWSADFENVVTIYFTFTIESLKTNLGLPCTSLTLVLERWRL